MPDPATLAVFCAASLALAVVPGPAVLYIVTQGVDQGRAAGVVSALGIATGGLVHAFAATVGLSALLTSSATAFAVVKYTGAAYLVLLGVMRLLRRDDEEVARPPRPRRRLYRDGVVVNVLNPKTALFFLAFLPQFVDPNGTAPAAQIFVLGLIFVAIALASDSLWAVTAGTLGALLKQSRAYLAVRRWVSGTVFVVLGLSAARTS